MQNWSLDIVKICLNQTHTKVPLNQYKFNDILNLAKMNTCLNRNFEFQKVLLMQVSMYYTLLCNLNYKTLLLIGYSDLRDFYSQNKVESWIIGELMTSTYMYSVLFLSEIEIVVSDFSRIWNWHIPEFLM